MKALLGAFRAFRREEDGVAVVEIVLILVVLIALVIIFKDQITGLLNTILSKVKSQSAKVYN
ncbi:MAG: Flp1 family type IVb pilin [Lachnospiraceae bacterium]|nr:Flp1 family type IVb pilin [Lachnospiraceae bacterium]